MVKGRRLGGRAMALAAALSGCGAAVSLAVGQGFVPWFYQASALLFLSYAVRNLMRKKVLTAMALLPQSLVMLLGTSLMTAPFLPDLPRFPLALMTPDRAAIFLDCLILYSVILIGITERSRVGEWIQYDFRANYHPNNKRALFVFLGLGFVLIYLTVPGTSIFAAPYATAEQRTGAVIATPGLKVIGVFLVCAAMNLGATMYGVRSRRYLLLLLTITVFVGWFVLLRGDRGGTLPMILTASFLYLIASGRPTRARILRLMGFLLVLFPALVMMSYFRANAAREGVGLAVIGAGEYVWQAFSEAPGRAKSGLLLLPLLPQSFWHGLHIVDLYEMGVRLNGRSFFDIIPQSIPSPIANLVGYERPLNGAWRLAGHRIHGGGMNGVALAYWNLGVGGVVLFAALIGLLANALESWYRRQPPVAVGGYFAFAGALPYLMLYGWQPLVTTLWITVVMAAMVQLFMRSYRQEKDYRASSVRPREPIDLRSSVGETQ